MRRYKKIIILLFISILIILVVKYISTKPTLHEENIKSITIATLPSPPKVKKITRKEDIAKFVNYYNQIKGKPLILRAFQSQKGWELLIKIDDGTHTLTLIGNEIEVDGHWFVVDDEVKENVKKLYNDFDYEEMDYIMYEQ